jgi:hypothetical protein
MEALRGRGGIASSHSFLNSALGGVSGQRQAPAALYSRREDNSTHWTGGWVGPMPVWVQRLQEEEEEVFVTAGDLTQANQSPVRHCTDLRWLLRVYRSVRC